MKNIKDLTPEEKKSISDHYKAQHQDLIDKLTEAVGGMVKQNDMLGLIWLAEVTRITIEKGLVLMPDGPDDPGKLVGGWPVSGLN